MIALLLACAGEIPADTAAAVPFWEPEIRALTGAWCLGCHRTGGDALPALDSYAAAAAWSDRMLAAVEDGRMPPAPADPACRSYEGAISVPPEGVARLRAWVEAGAPEGAGGAQAEAESWASGEAEQADAGAEVYLLPAWLPTAGLSEEWRCAEVGTAEATERYLGSIALEPGTASAHQMILYAVPAVYGEVLEGLGAAEGYDCPDGPLGNLPDGAEIPAVVATWTAGQAPILLEGGIAVPAGARLVAQVQHRLRGAVPEVDQGRAALRWVEAPAEIRRVGAVRYAGLEIPPNTPIARRTLEIPWYGLGGEPLVITALSGQMHRIGTSLRLDGLSSGGEADDAGGAGCLLDLARWDHDWQQRYALSEAAEVRDGERLLLECTWENSGEDGGGTITGGPGGELCAAYVERLSRVEAADLSAEQNACALSCAEAAGQRACAEGCLASAALGGDVAACLAAECGEAAGCWAQCDG